MKKTISYQIPNRILHISKYIYNQEVCLKATIPERVRNSSLNERSCVEDEIS